MLLIKAVCREHQAAPKSGLWPAGLPRERGAGRWPRCQLCRCRDRARGRGLCMGTRAAHRAGSTRAALEARGAFGSARGLHAGWHVHTVSLSPLRSTVQGRHNLEDEGSPKVLLQQAIHIISIQLEKVSCIFASCCVPSQSAVLYQIPLSTFQSPSPPGFGFLSAVLHLRKLLQYLIFWCPGNLALNFWPRQARAVSDI